MTKGNKVTLLVDGPATYAAMFKAIRKATDHINIETFTMEDIEDETGVKLTDLLLQKQAAGVQVNILYDRKILIVDGKIAFTGGVNISQVYSSGISGRRERDQAPIPWRDTDVQIEGPAVAEFQKLFLDTWQRQEGAKLSERNYFLDLKKEMGNTLVGVLGSSPGEANRITFILYVSAITFAENSLHRTNAYFVPDRQTVDALTDAAKRGVDVKIILPGTTDSSLAHYAGQYYYRLGVYPLGEDIPRYPASAIFLVLAQVLQGLLVLRVLLALQALQPLPSPVLAQAFRAFPEHQAHPVLRALPSPLPEVVRLIDYSQTM